MIRLEITRLASNSAVYGIGHILQRFTGLLLLPFFTSTLSTIDYGVISLVGVVTASAIGIFNLGTANSISLLYFSESNERSRDAVIWTGVILLSVNNILLLSLLYPALPLLSNFAYGTDQYSHIMGLSLVGQSFAVVADPFMSYLRMNNRPLQYITITTLVFLATTGLSIWLVLFHKIGVIGMIMAQAAGQMLLLFLSLCLIGRNISFSYKMSFFKPLVFIGFPSIFSSLAHLLLSFSDRWFLEHFLGLGALGVYSVGASFGMFMALLVGAFDMAWPPFFASYINRRQEATKIFPLVFTYYVLGFGSLCVVFFAAAKPTVQLLTAKPFHDAYLVIGLVATSQVFYGAYSILGTGIYYSKKLGWLSLFKWIAAAINIGLNIVLIPNYGILGAAISMFFGYLSLLPMAYLVSRKEFPLSYEWRRLSKFLFAVGVVSCLVWGAARSVDTLSSSIAGLIGVLVIVGYTYIGILTKAEQSYMISMLKNLSRKTIR